MDINQELIVRNIKVSFKTKALSKSVREFSKTSIKFIDIKPSFFVKRHNKFVFCVYYTGHINVTGLSRLDQIKHCAKLIKQIPGIQKISYCKVDNITCTGSVTFKSKSVFLKLIKFAFDSSSNLFDRIKYCQETFSGALFANANGTLVLFMSGKFNIVGCDTYLKAITLYNDLLKLLDIYYVYSTAVPSLSTV